MFENGYIDPRVLPDDKLPTPSGVIVRARLADAKFNAFAPGGIAEQLVEATRPIGDAIDRHLESALADGTQVVTAAARVLGDQLARELDDALRAAITKRIGMGWRLEDVGGRASQRAEAGWDVFYLDGQPILRAGPTTFVQEGNWLTAKRPLEHL